MKKLYFTESQIHKHLLCEDINGVKLPKFLFDKIKNHKSFLGDNAAFPPEEDYPFDYKVLKSRYIQVCENIKSLHLESLEYDFLLSLLSKLIKECREIEKPIKANLCKLCENIVIDLFKIPEETVNLTCELVGKIQPKKNSYRTLPETSENRKFDFEDMEDFHNVSKVILKRRLINSLIQGASYTYSTSYDTYINHIYKLDKRLIDLYDKITIINDYLLFAKEVKIDDKNPMQSAYVEVELGMNGERTNITSQGLIFPFLLMETIRGFFELFASHGLPEDNNKALYIIKQSDFLSAEPWDLRMGVGLWHFIGKEVDNTQVLPYLFSTICEMKVDDFNTFLQEIFAQTKLGKEQLQELIDDSNEECERNDFLDTMKKKNDEKALIEDGDFTLEELDNYTLNEEEDENVDDENSKEELSVEILAQINPLDITFDVSSAMPSWYNGKKMIYQLIPVVQGKAFLPQDGVNFRAEDVTVNGQGYYQTHIDIAQEYRRMGIAFNLYKAFILQGYPACSLFKNRTASFNRENNTISSNDNAIPSLWRKLSTTSGISVEPLYNKHEKQIGVKATATSFLQENTNLETLGYHGTPHEFDGFDIAYVNSGFGQQEFGYGIYLSFDKEFASGYGEGGYLYTVEIPDNESLYLHQDEEVPSELIEKIHTILFEKNLPIFQEDYEDEAEYTLRDELETFFPYGCYGKELYYSMDKFTNSDKETSEILNSLGIIGYKYYDAGCQNVVMFNGDDIKIVDKSLTESKSLLKEYMASWRDKNVRDLVSKIYNELQPYINKKTFKKAYQYQLNGKNSIIEVHYNPNKKQSQWNGSYYWDSNMIILSFEGNITPQTVSTAVHHEVTHYLDKARERGIGKELYKNYGDNYIQNDKNDQFVKAVNEILYRLWDESEMNAYLSQAVYSGGDIKEDIKNINKYYTYVNNQIAIIETKTTKNENAIWQKIAQQVKSKSIVNTASFKQWFIKQSKIKLDTFKKRALKNLYMHKENYGSDEYTSNGYKEIPTSAMNPTITTNTKDSTTNINTDKNIRTRGSNIGAIIARNNAYFVSIGQQIENIRKSQPISGNEEAGFFTYNGNVKIKEEEMPIQVTESNNTNTLKIEIPNTEISESFNLSEYNKNKMSNPKYIALGKTLNSMFKKYQEHKKELEQKEKEEKQKSVE